MRDVAYIGHSDGCLFSLVAHRSWIMSSMNSQPQGVLARAVTSAAWAAGEGASALSARSLIVSTTVRFGRRFPAPARRAWEPLKEDLEDRRAEWVMATSIFQSVINVFLICPWQEQRQRSQLKSVTLQPGAGYSIAVTLEFTSSHPLFVTPFLAQQSSIR